MADQNGDVRITLRDVYESVQEIKESVSTLSRDSRIVEDHESRLRAVERRVWTLPSLATLVAIASLVAAILAVQGAH